MDFAVLLAIWFWSATALAVQPSTPAAPEGPLRELEFGDLNFLHTTDTHGWHAGHLLEASYGADWGDYVDFAGRLREKAESEGRDLLVIDTGDRVEGNGLYDASEPKGKYTFDIFKEQKIDLICSGNHELYKQNTSENEYFITVPAYRDNYLASNLDIVDPDTGKVVPLAPQRFKRFTTKIQGLRIMSFGFIFDFTSNYNNTIITPVEEAILEPWFQKAIRDRDIDLFVVVGHVPVRSKEFDAVHRAIREVNWDTPIQFFGGHFHIRDYHIYDSKSHGLASGRFMETIGFQSINGLSKTPKASSAMSASIKFSRRYIDNNLYSFYHHSGHNQSTFHSEHGRNVTKLITKSRSELGLDTTFGCAPKDLWMSRARYPSDDSVFTWLEKDVFPSVINDSRRAGKPRVVITNTGAIRFDIFKGPFTRDSTFIVSPFTSGFHFIKDVPYATAKKLFAILNNEDQVLQSLDPKLEAWRLAPLEQAFRSEDVIYSGWQRESHGQARQVVFSSSTDDLAHEVSKPMIPGYTTIDDMGTDGDDTIHTPINFYRVPNCIQATIAPRSQLVCPSDTYDGMDGNGAGEIEETETVDLVYNEFLQPWVLLGLKFLGRSYTDADVDCYMCGENLTNLLARWVEENWKENC